MEEKEIRFRCAEILGEDGRLNASKIIEEEYGEIVNPRANDLYKICLKYPKERWNILSVSTHKNIDFHSLQILVETFVLKENEVMIKLETQCEKGLIEMCVYDSYFTNNPNATLKDARKYYEKDKFIPLPGTNIKNYFTGWSQFKKFIKNSSGKIEEWSAFLNLDKQDILNSIGIPNIYIFKSNKLGWKDIVDLVKNKQFEKQVGGYTRENIMDLMEGLSRNPNITLKNIENSANILITDKKIPLISLWNWNELSKNNNLDWEDLDYSVTSSKHAKLFKWNLELIIRNPNFAPKEIIGTFKLDENAIKDNSLSFFRNPSMILRFAENTEGLKEFLRMKTSKQMKFFSKYGAIDLEDVLKNEFNVAWDWEEIFKRQFMWDPLVQNNSEVVNKVRNMFFSKFGFNIQKYYDLFFRYGDITPEFLFKNIDRFPVSWSELSKNKFEKDVPYAQRVAYNLNKRDWKVWLDEN